ncbi:MAG: hypothetical protein ABI782_04960 [Anaerolineaceae bacterium]
MASRTPSRARPPALLGVGHEPLDCGGRGETEDDYADFVRGAAEAMSARGLTGPRH